MFSPSMQQGGEIPDYLASALRLPIFLLLQIISPSNLVLDSEPSNAAEWSFSMATPLSLQTVKETPTMATCVSVATSVGTCSTVGETVQDTPTTDESILELRRMLGSQHTRQYKKQTCRRRHPANVKKEKV